MRPWLTVLALVLAFNHIDAVGAAQRRDAALWVTFGDSDQLVEIDAYTFKEIRRLNTYTHALQLVKNDTELWVTDCVNDLLRIVRTSDLTEVAQIRVGKFPHWIAVRPDGQVLFVSLWDPHAVAAIDIASRKVLTNIQFPRGSGPKRILVAPKPS
jgi:hypothetical protein